MAVFTVVRTIGAAGDFTTVQAWDDAAPVALTTAERSAAGTFDVAEFIQGESLTFVGSGATGKFLDTDSTGIGTGTYISYGITAGNPAAADVVTGGTSGATCTLSSSTAIDVGCIWEGHVLNENITSATTLWTATGNTTSATAYMHLKAAPGASFRDHADKLTNPLRVDSTKGATLTLTGGGTTCVSIALHYTRISDLQLQCTGAGNRCWAIGGTSSYMTNCICEATVVNAASSSFLCSNPGPTVRNTVLIQRAGNSGNIVNTQNTISAFYNCTIVAPIGLHIAPANVFTSTSGGTITIQNCAIFTGSDSTVLAQGGNTYNFTTCVSNITGTANVSKAYFDQVFVNAGNSGTDLRLSQNAAPLLDTGTTDATNAPDDIVGTARPVGGAYDIGAWETAYTAADQHMSNVRHTKSGRAKDHIAKRKHCKKRYHK